MTFVDLLRETVTFHLVVKDAKDFLNVLFEKI